jgi:3-hydroxybutyryl-CoA dehydrogenase
MEIKTIAVLGTGTIGFQIAQVAAMRGYVTRLRDIEWGMVESGLRRIREGLDVHYLKKGKMTQPQVEEILGRLSGSVDLEEAVQDVDLVFESIPPDIELKKRLFKELDEKCPPHTILASNTSNMSITEIGSLTRRKDKVVGTHFFNPVQVMRLIEVVRTAHTSDETVDAILSFAAGVKKETIVINDYPGFICSRITNVILNEAIKIVHEGVATAEQVDRAMRLGMNHPVGPFQIADINLEVPLHGLEYLQRELGENYRPCPLLKKMVNAGLLGHKTGKGFHAYDKEALLNFKRVDEHER